MTDSERARFEILLEDIRTQVGVIADGHLGLSERMDGFDRHLHAFEQRVDRRFDAIAVDLADVKRDVSVLKTDVSVLKTDVGDLKLDVGDLKVRVTHIEERPDRGGAPRTRAARRAARR